MTNVSFSGAAAHTDLTNFFHDLLIDESISWPVRLADVRQWASDDGDNFELAVILALGFDRSGWDAPDDAEFTQDDIKAAMLKLGVDFDKEQATKTLEDHLKIYQCGVDSCGNEPQYRVAKSGYIRLRDAVKAQLDTLHGRGA